MNTPKTSYKKNNHYNPCFWTAYWNKDYYENLKYQKGKWLVAREQCVHTLNFQANKYLFQKVEKIFYEKNASILHLTGDDVIKYYQTYHPQKPTEEYADEIGLDFENLFTEFEVGLIDTLKKVIIDEKFNDKEDKATIAFFLLFQGLRHPNHMNPFFKQTSKLEFYIQIRETFSNQNLLMAVLRSIVKSKWTLYKAKAGKHFPLGDSIYLKENSIIMFALSPTLLLEINLKKVGEEDFCLVKDIGWFKYYQFKKRTINTSSFAIIFYDKKVLDEWQKSRLYKRRINFLKRKSKIQVDKKTNE